MHLLLNWGEIGEDLVIDPEYLSNMEHPTTTLASKAGLHSGYGTGLFNSFVDGYPMLGHNGGIDGFSSAFAYSTTRDVGYVVLLNGRYSRDAMRRISQLAVRYLKADVEPPPKTQADVPDAVLRGYEGYYHDANPRNQAFAFVQWLMEGQSITVDGRHLTATPVFGSPAQLVPVSNNLFRLEADPEPTRVFATDESGTMVLTGGSFYAERKPRWRVESVRWPVLISAGLVLTPLLMMIPWIVHARRAEARSGFWWLKFWLLCCSIGFVLPVIGYINVTGVDLGTRNVWTAAMFTGSILFPAAAIVAFLFTVDALLSAAGKWLRAYALLRLGRGADRRGLSVGVGHAGLQAVELLTPDRDISPSRIRRSGRRWSRATRSPRSTECRSSRGRRRTRRPTVRPPRERRSTGCFAPPGRRSGQQ